MKTLLTSGFFWFVLFIGFVALFTYLLKRWGEVTAKQAKEYEDYYREVQEDLWRREANEHTYDIISYKLNKLIKMPYKNREKTSVLLHKFNKKFLTSRLQKVIETNLKKKR